MVKFLDYF